MKIYYITTILLVLSSLELSAKKDSLISSISFKGIMYNDNNPISNQKLEELRKRDDHGLTFQYGYSFQLIGNFFKQTKTIIDFVDNSGLYTKGLGSSTAITPDYPNYKDYKYLQEIHPDWDNLYVNDQIAYSKNTKTLSFINEHNRFRYGIAVRYTAINSGINQGSATVQRKFHSILKSKNYIYEPFVDSSIFKSNKVVYFSIAPQVEYRTFKVRKGLFSIENNTRIKLWISSTNSYAIPAISPQFFSEIKIKAGKNMQKGNQKWEFLLSLLYEPLEIIPAFVDPGARGYFQLAFDYRISNKKKEKPLFTYIITPYSLYIPFNSGTDITMNYKAPKDDIKLIEGFFNLGVTYNL